MKNTPALSTLLALVLTALGGCSSTHRPVVDDNSYVSMGQMLESSSTDRPLTAHERSYLLGATRGVLAYIAFQRLNGHAEQAYACVTPNQMTSLTPEWIHKTMIQDVESNPLWSTQDSTDAAITAAMTLAKHFPCKNAPTFDPHGFDNTLDDSGRESGS